ncbi:MAG: transcriptional repressor LexA [Melioribacteraceae bacterium]|nr:transcriptional repressor LexA [Melioribacteraceae bacterium]MCF8411873.1 transcriptional repressor LexA [Melioribacteraceae bacterium]MCF8432237.1 transcriptional repressor LexA [Melioribacteraceae bacterium]
MTKILTDRQKEILEFLESYIELNGYSPTYREIASHFNLASTFGVKRHIDALNKKGFLNSESNSSRTLTLTHINQTQPASVDYIEIPVVGRVAAGYPILAEENIESTIQLSTAMISGKGEYFGLKVKGDSMINAGILEGDIVVVDQKQSVNNSDIIVGMLGHEATLKRFLKNSNRTALIPENPNYPEIEVTNRTDFSIIGKVIALFRNYN